MLDWSRWPNFYEREMMCRCGCGRVYIDPNFMDLLQSIRTKLGRPMVVISGFRCNKHNKAVGGARNSMHLVGRAAHIAMHPNLGHAIIRHAAPLMQGIGVDTEFIHIDNHDGPATIWTYSR